MAKYSGASKRSYRKSSNSHAGLWIFTILLFVIFVFSLLHLGKHKNVAAKTAIVTAPSIDAAADKITDVQNAKTQAAAAEVATKLQNLGVDKSKTAAIADEDKETATESKPTKSARQAAQPKQQATAVAKAKTTAEKDETKLQQQYDFYDLLSQNTDDVLQAEQSNINAKSESHNNSKAESNADYFLAVGKYKNYEDVDHLKAELAMLGYEVRIATTTNEGVVFYHVGLGPYVDKSTARDVQKQLAQHKIKAIIKNKNADE